MDDGGSQKHGNDVHGIDFLACMLASSANKKAAIERKLRLAQPYNHSVHINCNPCFGMEDRELF